MADTILTNRGGHSTIGGASRYTLSDYFLIISLPAELDEALNGTKFGNSTFDEINKLDSSSRETITNILNLGTNATSITNSTILLGGDDSYVGSISFQYKTNAWEVTGDPTGSWVHTKNRDRTGTCTLSMNQVAYKGAMLIKIFNIYYNDTTGDNDIVDGFDIYVTDRKGRLLMSAMDCYVQNVPTMEYGSAPRDLSWTFNCGRITYEDTI